MPSATKRSSFGSSSAIVSAASSSNTVAASANRTPCLLKLFAALFGSHSNYTYHSTRAYLYTELTRTSTEPEFNTAAIDLIGLRAVPAKRMEGGKISRRAKVVARVRHSDREARGRGVRQNGKSGQSTGTSPHTATIEELVSFRKEKLLFLASNFARPKRTLDCDFHHMSAKSKPVCGGAAKLAFVLTGESPVGGGAQMPP